MIRMAVSESMPFCIADRNANDERARRATITLAQTALDPLPEIGVKYLA
jgi:hypothetical protein